MPLDVPKKTRLYVEQTQRERAQAVDMHRVFQRDLAKMRLATAHAFVKVLTDGQVRLGVLQQAASRRLPCGGWGRKRISATFAAAV